MRREVLSMLALLAAAAVSAPALGGGGTLPGRTASRESAFARGHGRFSGSERDRLLGGDLVTRPLAFDRSGAHYVGGVSYQLVRASPDEVLTALQSVESLPEALPRTKSARFIDGRGRSARIELVQGNAMMEATYTVELLRTPGRNELRFWLDAGRPHDIDDVWGYFRVRRFDRHRSLVTVGVALDVGPGLVRMLFEDRIQAVILGTPRHIKDYVEPRALAVR